MLELDGVHTYYGDSHILQGVSLRVHAGEIVALLGRNGAGKTTAMRSIVGLTPPRRGRVLFDDADITGRPTHQIARGGIAFVASGRRVFGSLTVGQNLALAARSRRNAPRIRRGSDRRRDTGYAQNTQNIRHIQDAQNPQNPQNPQDARDIRDTRDGRDGRTGGAWTLQHVFETFPALAALAGRRAEFLSGGEQQMLKLGRALLSGPRLLLLDEPTEGLAPTVVADLGRWLELLRKERLAVLLTEQNALFALRHADRGYILEKGRIRHEDRADQLRDSHEIRAYLGVGAA